MENIIKTRNRSPNYPGYSLKDCVGFLKKLYEKYKNKEVYWNDAINQIGHSPTSSTGGRAISALTSFGLLEIRGTKNDKFVKATKLAQEIMLENEYSSEWYESLRKASLVDGSMKEVWTKWGKEIPHQDTIIKSLQLDMDYSPEGAKRFAAVIVDTYNFAKLSDRLDDNNENELKVEEANNQSIFPKDQIGNISNPSIRKTNLLLQGKNREIVVIVPDDLTNEEFELLQKWLEIQKFGLVINR
jgi:hypothetical protein